MGFEFSLVSDGDRQGGFLIGRAVYDVPSETQRHDAKEKKNKRTVSGG